MFRICELFVDIQNEFLAWSALRKTKSSTSHSISIIILIPTVILFYKGCLDVMSIDSYA